jgi:enterobacteria phage integrase
MDCKPHGLRTSLRRRLADADVSAHDIMAALGYTILKLSRPKTTRARLIGGRAVDAPCSS